MSLELTMGESRPKLPDGSYFAKFNGFVPVEAREWQGKQLEAGIRWEFTVSTGPHLGARTGRVTQPSPTKDNACGRMLINIVGKVPAFEDKVNLSDFVGKTYLIVMQKGRVETASLPPQQ